MGRKQSHRRRPPASGANKSPKRRKLNHGMQSKLTASSPSFETAAGFGTCSCSLCISSTICKCSIGSLDKGEPC